MIDSLKIIVERLIDEDFDIRKLSKWHDPRVQLYFEEFPEEGIKLARVWSTSGVFLGHIKECPDGWQIAAVNCSEIAKTKKLLRADKRFLTPEGAAQEMYRVVLLNRKVGESKSVDEAFDIRRSVRDWYVPPVRYAVPDSKALAADDKSVSVYRLSDNKWLGYITKLSKSWFATTGIPRQSGEFATKDQAAIALLDWRRNV